MSNERKGNILLIEDSVTQAASMQSSLSKLYGVDVANTAADGIHMLHTDSYDLVLLDINLPDKSGFDVLVEIREAEHTKNLPVLLMTSSSYDGTEVRGLELGASDFVPKPAVPAVLVARINTQLRMSRYIRQLESLTLIDGLTGIANRRNYDTRSIELFRNALRLQQTITFVMFDIDNFKAYNDFYGHPEGDRVLRAVATAISSKLRRSTDLIARYGGEEFVAVVIGGESERIFKYFCEIRQTVEDLAIKHAPNVQRDVTVSVGGITMLPREDADMAGFLKVADLMLYRAKKLGKNRVVWSDEHTHEIHEK